MGGKLTFPGMGFYHGTKYAVEAISAARVRVAVERGLLVRVLAVAQALHLLVDQRQGLGEGRGGIARLRLARKQPARDHGVVLRGVRERLGGERGAQRRSGRAGVRIQLGEHARVVRRVDHDGDGIVVLRGGAHHRRAADVDVLDRVLVAAAGLRDRLRERVEVDDQQVDALDAVLGHDAFVDAAPAEQAAVDLRVQRLDAAVHDLGEAGVLRDFLDGEAGLGEQFRGAARGEERDAAAREFAGQLDDAGLVGYREQRAADLDGHRDGPRGQDARPSSRSFLRNVPRLMPRIVAARLWLPSQCSSTARNSGSSTSRITRS